MAKERRSSKAREDAALAHARGVPLARWAREHGIPERTVRSWSATPEFKQTVADIRRRVRDRIVGKLVSRSAAAADEMARLMKNGTSEAVRLRAAEALLDRSIAWVEHYDYEVRLTELEERARKLERNGRGH